MYKIEITNKFKQSLKIEKDKLFLLLFDIDSHSNLFKY